MDVQTKQLVSGFCNSFKSSYPQYADAQDSIEHVMTDPRIVEILDHALQETAGRNYINKHGIEHAIQVARNTLTLFSLVEHDVVQSDYVVDFPNAELDKKSVLFALIVASYIHDAGRFYDSSIDHESQVSDAVEVLRDLRSQFLRDKGDTTKDALLRIIKELCLCHDKKDQISGKVEIALIKLADAMDCARNRVYTKPDWRGKRMQKIADIFKRDRHPEAYFGTYAVRSVDLRWLADDGVVETTLSIDDYAAAVPLRNILSVLRRSGEGRASVREFSQVNWIYLQRGAKERVLLHPETIVFIPGIEILTSEWEFDLEEGGDGVVDVAMKIKNSGRTPRKLVRFEFWGLKKVSWGNDAQVQMWDDQNRALEIEYRGEAEEPNSHAWAARLNDPLGSGEVMTIRGKYKWKQMIKISRDQVDYYADTPVHRLCITILFPKAIEANYVHHWSEVIQKPVRPPFAATLPEDLTSPTCFLSSTRLTWLEEKGGRACLHSEFDNLASGCIYRTRWKIKQA
jgi:metal-dependent HD superfamily phosphatase/phosphodiesterase